MEEQHKEDILVGGFLELTDTSNCSMDNKVINKAIDKIDKILWDNWESLRYFDECLSKWKDFDTKRQAVIEFIQ